MAQVRAETQYALGQMAVHLSELTDDASDADRAHYRMLASDIGRFMDRDFDADSAKRGGAVFHHSYSVSSFLYIHDIRG